ncbi:hypothetical protein PsYK624_064800 [Phanerochaete sordida]|uniref:Uncharacterized protein n=1 Tax=Phanerochaete sordida TaxID=48140 RepID=A0A9P3GAI6_9APHY|nr:hypothetical protein PsYK624_064800 [Phanerochaete sordida]
MRTRTVEDLSASPPPARPTNRKQRTVTRTSLQRQRQPTAEPTARPPSPAPSVECEASPLRSASTPAVRTTVSVSVRRFLAALRPSMRELAPVFALAGVRDRACLEALVAMIHAEQRAFLDRLPLNMFQSEVVLNGLAARRL